MKSLGTLKAGAVILASLGILVPTPVLHAATFDAGPPHDAEGRTQALVDVALCGAPQRDVLIGLVLDRQGAAQEGVSVALCKNGQRLAESRTDRNGHFRFANVRGGVYQLTAAGGVAAYRVWAPGTAPPSARQQALVVADDTVLRGQCGGQCDARCRPRCGLSGLKYWLAHPLVIAGIVAAAVAIPVAIHNARQDSPTSP